jgi:heme exporter protein C
VTFVARRSIPAFLRQLHGFSVPIRLTLPQLAVLAAALTGIALGLVFFVAPEDADQGISQKIFYIHVPIALTAYVCFGWGAWKALRHLWKRQPGADLESYTAIHQGVIFGVLTLVTGSMWARASWGVWWTWSSNQLVLFLVLFLFYSAYFMLRFSVDPGPQRENMSAVYALFGVALIPVSFLAIRLANDFIHPTVFTSRGPQMSTSMFVAFCVSWAAMLAIASTFYSVELAGKRLDARLRALREARLPSGATARQVAEVVSR